jgi:5-formyltetrahydrofolate cyclo-ligase
LLRFESNGPHRHRRVTLTDCQLQSSRAFLRAELRGARRAVPAPQRRRAAHHVALLAARALPLWHACRIGVYAALPEELDTHALIALARRQGARLYLPRIADRGARCALQFVPMGPRTRRNRFGIAEPRGPALPDVCALHIIFLPLVGFDRRGTRLGMGGGYYDRTLAVCRSRGHRPLLVGLAFSLQQRAYIARAAHDVPLDMVITERGIIRCTHPVRMPCGNAQTAYMRDESVHALRRRTIPQR